MELISSYTNHENERVEVFGGEIEVKELADGDEIVLDLGGEWVTFSILPNDGENIDANVFLGSSREHNLGVHAVKYARLNAKEGVTHRKPMPLDTRFFLAVEKQGYGGDIGKKRLKTITNAQASPNNPPVVLRRTKL